MEDIDTRSSKNEMEMPIHSTNLSPIRMFAAMGAEISRAGKWVPEQVQHTKLYRNRHNPEIFATLTCDISNLFEETSESQRKAGQQTICTES